ncbi:MAG: hypothetical protein U0892_04795 [Pirellulales bacterium]
MARSLSRLRRSTKRLAFALMISGGLCFGSASAQDSNVLTWINNNGAKLEASFLRLDGETVVVAKRDRSEVKIPLESLSLASQYQAKKSADPKAFEKPAPPPPPPKMEMDSSIESPFPDAPTPEQTVQIILDQLKAKKPGVLWHALPKSMQDDVAGLMPKTLELAGPTATKQFQVLMQNLLVITRDKQSMIAKSRVFAQNPDAVAGIKRIMPRYVPLLETLAAQSTWSPANFTQENAGPWFVTVLNRSGELMAHVETKPIHLNIGGTAGGGMNPYGSTPNPYGATPNPYGGNSGDAAQNFQGSGGAPAPMNSGGGMTPAPMNSGGGMAPAPLSGGGDPNSGMVNSGGGSGAPAGQPQQPQGPAKVPDEVDIAQVKFKVIKSDANTAEIEFTIPGQSTSVGSFTKVDNRWLPTEMVNGWNTQISAIRSVMNSIPSEELASHRKTISGGLAFVNGLVGGLASARTQDEVDLALVSILSIIPMGSSQPGAGNMAGNGGMMTPGMPNMGMQTPGQPNSGQPSGGFPGRSATSSQ